VGFKSFFMLGTRFLVHLLSRIFFFYRPGGTQRFLANFEEDRLRPVAAEIRPLLPAWQRCTNCGLCEAACPLGPDQLGLGRVTPGALASSTWRELTAHRLARTAAQAIANCQGCQACEKICPERVPLLELARFVAQSPV
jgi:ferredoxin